MKTLLACMFLCTSIAAQPLQYSLEFFADPVPGWSKNRLAGQVLPGNGGFRIYDLRPQDAPFDDAETFKVDAPLTLPYGEKKIALDMVVGEGIKPLWGNRLMQFQVNGRELDVAVSAEGVASFEKEFGDDGKGFVPAVSGHYEFALEKDLTDVQFISFMTAGASGYDLTVKNVVISVQPEEDLRPRPYLLRFNRLGYLNDQPQPVLLEWQADLTTDKLPLTVRQASHDETQLDLKRGALNNDSGMALTVLDLALPQPDYTTLIIPETVKRTKHTSALLRIRDSLSEYEKVRDQALGAFHWFDMRTYPGAHEQDHNATVFGTGERKDVYGGWYDAGDYGRYSVNGAWSVYVILLSYVADPAAFDVAISPLQRTEPARRDVLDLLVPELNFLAAMQRDDGAVYHKVNSRDWPALTVAPVDDTEEKFIMPISTTATADVAAVMNLAAFVFGQSELAADKKLAANYRSVAQKANAFLDANPQRIMIEDRYDGYEYGGPYTDANDDDERLLARVSRGWQGERLSPADREQLLALAAQSRFGDETPDWMNVRFLVLFSALMQPSDGTGFSDQLLARVESQFETLLQQQAQNPYGILYAGPEKAFSWGSNGIIATVGTQLLWLHRLTGNERYWQAAYRSSHWFFGLNPHGVIFATGNSRFHVQRPHFRPLVSQAAPQPFGLLAGGPNSVELKGDTAAAPLFNKAPMQVYIDHQDSWATNEVAINWQSAWASYLSLLTQRQ